MSWSVASLADVATINPRVQKDQKLPDIVTFLPMAAVSEEGEVVGAELRPLEEVRKGFTYFERDDVLLAKITPCFENGKATFLDRLETQVGFGSTEFHVIRPDEKQLDGKFLFYLLWNARFRHEGVRNMTGSAGQRRVPTTFLERYTFPLPPLATQKHIARVLEQADQLRKQAQQMERELNQLAQSLFVEMFGDPIKNLKGWVKVPISYFVDEFEGGKSVAAAGDESAASKSRVLKISAVTWREFNPSESKPLPENYQPELSHFVRKGDLLFSRANTTELVGATSYVFEEYDNLLLPDKLWRFVWKNDVELSPMFIWNLFMDPSFRVELGKLSSGSGGSMKNISKGKLLPFEVIFPPSEMQKSFEKKFLKIRDEILACRRKAAECDAIFESLMQRAFNGELTAPERKAA